MCAIVGIIGNSEAANITYLGLHALQHRGQEGAGIVSTNGKERFAYRALGKVGSVFNETNLQDLKGHSAIGHTRYSTAGGNNSANLQPILLKSSLGWLAFAHNGNLVNANELRDKLEQEGAIFQSTSDTEVIGHLMSHSKEKDTKEAFVKALKQVKGAYSLLLLNSHRLLAVRDTYGFRPLVMGKTKESLVFASETTAFDLIGAEYLREVEPGEMIEVPLDRPLEFRSSFPFAKTDTKRCIFEYIYFARPDSLLYGKSVYEMRKKFGKRLSEEHPVEADVVVPVPDSGVSAAIGYSQASGIPYDTGIIRSHYIGRTFIEPRQSIRDFGVRLKLSPVKEVLAGKRVIVIDDSLVRGTTSKKLVKHLREAGAKEVHMRISAPPTTHSCFYGIDTPTREELLASSHSVEEIRKYIGADSLGYLSLPGLLEVMASENKKGFCHACFSGEYVV